jgi:biotin operon repressor
MTNTTGQQRQEAVLRVLREAGDRPVSLVELRGRGIPSPASVIYELELAGLPIDRVHRHGRLLGVRLLAGDDNPPPPAKRGRRLGR